MEDGSPKRDIQNHVLFECSTEVANRGELQLSIGSNTCSPYYSWWNLLCIKVKGTRHHRRVWRPVYSCWTPQQSICKSGSN